VHDSYVKTSPITIPPNSYDPEKTGPASYGDQGRVASQPRSVGRPVPIHEDRTSNQQDGPIYVGPSEINYYSKPREISQPADDGLDIGTPSSSSFQEHNRSGSFKSERLSGLKFSISPFRDASPLYFMQGPTSTSPRRQELPVLDSSPSARSGSRATRRRSSASEQGAPFSDTTDGVFDFQLEKAPIHTPIPYEQNQYASQQRVPFTTTGRGASLDIPSDKPPSRSSSKDRLSNSDTVKLDEFMRLMNSMPDSFEHAETTLEPFSARFDQWSSSNPF